MISWVVKVYRHAKEGTSQATTVPCADYSDAVNMAKALGSMAHRSADIALSLPQPRGGNVFIPDRMLSAVRDAIDEALEVMTAPADKTVPIPKVKPFKAFPTGASMDEICDYIDNNVPKLEDKFD